MKHNTGTVFLVHWIAQRLLTTLLVALCLGCAGTPSGSFGNPAKFPPAGAAIPPIPIVAGQPVRVLFIGNSLTQANALPAMVTALSASVGIQVQATDVSQGGFSLEDHWNAVHAPRAVDRGGWHFVILQQGPSSLLSSRENLRLWAARFNKRIRAVGGRPALYMVWPEAARLSVFDDVHNSYQLAAQDINGIFLPAGDVWRAAWKRDPALQLYGPDDFHPSLLGTYAAALVITSKITAHSPVGLPYDFTLANGTHIKILARDAENIQAAAAEVLASE